MVEGVTELVCHPGLGDDALTADYDWGYGWDRETAALCDERVKEALQERSIHLAPFAALEVPSGRLQRMHSFRAGFLSRLSLPLSSVWLLSEIAEAKGRQGLFTGLAPQVLDSLRETALVQSVESSNRIEGVTVAPERLRPLVLGEASPRDRSEEEIRGYRRALDLIHSSARELAITPALLQRFHGLLEEGAGDAGEWKRREQRDRGASAWGSAGDPLPSGTRGCGSGSRRRALPLLSRRDRPGASAASSRGRRARVRFPLHPSFPGWERSRVPAPDAPRALPTRIRGGPLHQPGALGRRHPVRLLRRPPPQLRRMARVAGTTSCRGPTTFSLSCGAPIASSNGRRKDIPLPTLRSIYRQARLALEVSHAFRPSLTHRRRRQVRRDGS